MALHTLIDQQDAHIHLISFKFYALFLRFLRFFLFQTKDTFIVQKFFDLNTI